MGKQLLQNLKRNQLINRGKNMSTFKRFLAWTLLVISVIGILVCAFGVVGSWMVNDQLTNGAVNLLASINTTLSSVEDSLKAASDQLETANTAISTIQEAAAQLKAKVEDNTPILDRITLAVDEGLNPSVTKLRDIFNTIWERVLAVNNIIESINVLPGIELPTLTPQIEAINDQIDTLIAEVQQIQEQVAGFKSGIIEKGLDPFIARVDKMASFLTTMEQNVDTFIQQIISVEVAVESLQAKIPSMIDSVTILLSILLIWAILAQISLVLVSILYLRTGRMVWEFNPPGQPAEKPLMEPGIK
jgi:hypothetical protein